MYRRGKAMPPFQQKILNTAPSTVAKAFIDVILDVKQSKCPYCDVSELDTSKGSYLAIISATSYYQFPASAPFVFTQDSTSLTAHILYFTEAHMVHGVRIL